MEEKKESMSEDMKRLIEQNIKLTKEILKLSKKNNKMLNWQRAWGIFKLLLIVIPIILGVIYLPPLFDKVIDFYQDLLGWTDNAKSITPKNINLDSFTPDILKKIQK